MRVRERFELVKLVCVPVVMERDGDRIVGETEGAPRPCYSIEQLQEYWAKCAAEVAQINANAESANGVVIEMPSPEELAAAATEMPPGVPGGHLG